MNKRTAAVLAVLTAVLAVGVGAVPSSAAPLVALDDDRATSAPTVGLSVCNGGVQEASNVRMQDVPTNLVENGAFAPLPGASIAVTTPAGDSDQLVIIFSAEAQLQGQALTYAAPMDFLQVRILVDGVVAGPNDLSFTTGAGESDATQACKRVSAPAAAAMVHTVSVEWMIVDQGANNVLTGTLDDWTLNVQVSN
ncbi:hypothetical protein Cs7R123_62450 [Catellatospora sp. TT07R-123]|uniref:hypothetical protein n=1 Tax=Catellatospora sp. TT07R-123 TaxID=2733863 RepID=UPI001B04EDB8|nr:hypothetical protein [Catellatospora sp. TT07R-123]GHJ48903.1 hypothetical protein Cs7R123_62450 [Catellatospora sp. TT07R-123]